MRNNTPAGRSNNYWYCPPNDSNTAFVFVHGIFSSSRTCWLNEDLKPPIEWPDIISSDPRLGAPSIYMGGYATSPETSDYFVADCARELFEALERPGRCGEPPVMSKRNIFFIAHSTGGIVVRYMLLNEQQKFARKGVGLLLCASPTLGSGWANLFAPFAWLYRQGLGLQLRWMDVTLADLNRQFEELVTRREDRMPGLHGAETCETHMIIRQGLPWYARIFVPIGWRVVSAKAAGQFFKPVRKLPGTDHFSTVKPPDADHCAHDYLVTFYLGFRRHLEGLRSLRRRPPRPSPGPELQVQQIIDPDSHKDLVTEALELYRDRLPHDVTYSIEEIMELARHHLAGDYGPDWKMYFLVATFRGHAVGMLIAYDDLRTNLALIAFLAAYKETKSKRKPADVKSHPDVQGPLLRKMIELCMAGNPQRELQFLFEAEDPNLGPTSTESIPAAARLVHFAAMAPVERAGLSVRGLRVPYLQPLLRRPWTGHPRRLMLCYVARDLGDQMTRERATELLRWTYLDLYGEDIFEDPDDRRIYGAHIRDLFARVSSTVPDPVQLIDFEEYRPY